MIARALMSRSRHKRAELFNSYFRIDEKTKILDLGSENGDHIASLLKNTNFRPENVYIADIKKELVLEGNRKYGFTPIEIQETGSLPFSDKYLDIVFCSSVIEHVTVEKEAIWDAKSQRNFISCALRRQEQFAMEIERIGNGYFVQTPSKNFPIETHTWLPFAGLLPRPILIDLIMRTNKFWIKKTSPDWNLLTKKEMRVFFPSALIIEEKFIGFSKSIIAIKPLKIT